MFMFIVRGNSRMAADVHVYANVQMCIGYMPMRNIHDVQIQEAQLVLG